MASKSSDMHEALHLNDTLIIHFKAEVER
jgi:hypothetical protein